MRTLFTLAMLTSIVGCGSTLDASKKAIVSAETFVGRAALAFEAYDRQEQSRIAHDPSMTTTPTGEALAAYRKKRQPILDAFHRVDHALIACDALLPLVESGLREDRELAVIIQEAMQALQALQAVLKDFGVSLSILGVNL